MNPPTNLRLLQYKRVVLEEFHIFLDALLNVGERQKRDLVYLRCTVWGVRLELVTEDLVGEGEHAAISVVVQGDLARAEKLLGDNDAAKGIGADLPGQGEYSEEIEGREERTLDHPHCELHAHHLR